MAIGGSRAPCCVWQEAGVGRGSLVLMKLSLGVGFPLVFQILQLEIGITPCLWGPLILVTPPQRGWMAEGSQEALLLCWTRGQEKELRVRSGVCEKARNMAWAHTGPLCSPRRPEELRQVQFNFRVCPEATGKLEGNCSDLG